MLFRSEDGVAYECVIGMPETCRREHARDAFDLRAYGRREFGDRRRRGPFAFDDALPPRSALVLTLGEGQVHGVAP